MTKRQAIEIVNRRLNGIVLTHQNTHWSNIVRYGRDEGWWLNIPFVKFENDLHLILNDEREAYFLHVRVRGGSFVNPQQWFRDKNGTADIFLPTTGDNRLVDMQARGTQRSFKRFPSVRYPHGIRGER